jgi:hypothetical protein
VEGAAHGPSHPQAEGHRNMKFSANKRRKGSRLAALFAGQPTMELMIAKFLDARTSDFIEPLHGN